MPTCSLRLFSVFGERLTKQLFWDIYQKSKSGKHIGLFGTGEESRDFIYVGDLAIALDKILQHTRFAGEVINVSSGVETTIRDAANSFCRQLGNDYVLEFNGQRKEGDPVNWRADIRLLESFDLNIQYLWRKGYPALRFMVKRRRIANYRVNYDFSAGIVIYIQNLIKGFKLLEDSLQPHLTIIYTEDSPIQEVKEIDYPYIDYFKYKPIRKNFFTKAINKISRETIGTNILRRYSFPSHADILYLLLRLRREFFLKRRYYWKPDFQEMYYPQYVSQVEYSYVVENMKRIASNQEYTLILSSQIPSTISKSSSAFPQQGQDPPFHFLLPDISQLNPKQVLMKYGIDKKFFVVSNQFWPHKNHRLVLEAINKIKEKHTDFVVVFTGKQSTYRDREYFSKLQVYINNENMKDHGVRFIGFIPGRTSW